VVAQRCRGGDGKRCGGVEVVVLWRECDGGRGESGEWVYSAVEEMRKKENSDLKIGHVRPKYECVSAKWALRSNV
jgi:hypothetical protein